MSRLPILLIFFVACQCISAVDMNIGVRKLEEIFAWKQLSYNIGGSQGLSDRYASAHDHHGGGGLIFEEKDNEDTPDEATLQDENFFIQSNNLPIGVDRWRGKFFITVPRRREGVPSTLNYIDLSEGRIKSPALRPYPNLAANTLTSQKPLVSVYRTRVDACNRLWLVDTGILEIPNAFRKIQPPALVIYDLKTNHQILRHEFKEGADFIDPEGLISITVDVDKNSCADAFAYIPDIASYAMLVYSLKARTAWRVKHSYFNNDAEGEDFDLNGLKFSWSDGIFSIALGPVQRDGFKTAYFHAMASYRESSVSTKVLKNKMLATSEDHGDYFKALGNRGPSSQCTMHVVHPGTEVMFFAQVGNNTLSCWKTTKPLTPRNIGIVARDPVNFMYPADLKLDKDHILVLTNRLPRFIYSQLDANDVNFRVHRVSVYDAIKGTVCA